MKSCPECNAKFKLSERLKSLNRNKREIKCNNCNSIFIEKNNSFQISTSVMYGVIAFLSCFLSGWIIDMVNNIIVGVCMVGLISMLIMFISMLIFQNWISYKKIK